MPRDQSPLSTTPKHRRGDLFKVIAGNPERSMFGIPTNNVIKSDNTLVMGAGFARTVRERLPGFDYVAAAVAHKAMQDGEYPPVRVTYPFEGKPSHWFLFQTKRHFEEDSDLDLIGRNAQVLGNTARAYPGWTFHLPYPGAGCGNLEKADIWQHLQHLPSNVTLWEK